MCYRGPAQLDLSGIHVACLAGDNGHGKSAILDGITWALWGKARARYDHDLVTAGEREMEVEFVFCFGDAQYRIIRKRELHRRSRGSVDLHIRDNGSYRSLTASTQRETQARIRDILRMDYDTFINSALLLQGRADEFTVKAAAERQTVGALRSREGHARQVLGAVRQKLDFCSCLARERKERASQLKALARDRSLYEELRVAFGKRGVQALIIENILPELEDEANDLLRRMTEGRMSVHFETQRDTKSGGAVETLDIEISDESGARGYEMYSGGEAFRIDFAIRIALSKLLARRAGAQLQTLIIDEGFGTQDAQGRQRLVEAINTIQDDFALILVITHIEELKDAFPVRIDVFRTPLGSQVSIR